MAYQWYPGIEESIAPVGSKPSPYDLIKLTGPRSIRILKIHGTFKPLDLYKPTYHDVRIQEPIFAELLEVDRGDPKVCYEALSYPWGDPSQIGLDKLGNPQAPRRIIIIAKDFNGNDAMFWVEVGENLALALVQLRHEYENEQDGAAAYRYIWVDSICINQKDLEEKNHQVSQMGHIYVYSQRTVAIPDPGLVINTIHEPPLNPFRAEHRQLRFRSEEEPGSTLKWFRASRERAEFLRPMWEHILSCNYFNRAWIVQEVVLGPEVIVYFGTEQLSWNEFSWKANKFFREHPLPSAKQEESIFNIRCIDNYRRARYEQKPGLEQEDGEEFLREIDEFFGGYARNAGTQEQSVPTGKGKGKALVGRYEEQRYQYEAGMKETWRIPFVQLLSGDGGKAYGFHLILNATDPHDKIYAIRALAAEGNDERLYVNYKESAKDLMIRFASVLITGRDGHFLLEESRRHDGSRFPSWIPDWLAASFRINLASYHAVTPYSKHAAWDRRPPSAGNVGSFSVDTTGRRLTVTAVFLGSISHIGPSHEYSEKGPGYGWAWLTVLKELQLLMDNPSISYRLPPGKTAGELRWSLLRCRDINQDIPKEEIECDTLSLHFIPIWLASHLANEADDGFFLSIPSRGGATAQRAAIPGKIYSRETDFEELQMPVSKDELPDLRTLGLKAHLLAARLTSSEIYLRVINELVNSTGDFWNLSRAVENCLQRIYEPMRNADEERIKKRRHMSGRIKAFFAGDSSGEENEMKIPWHRRIKRVPGYISERQASGHILRSFAIQAAFDNPSLLARLPNTMFNMEDYKLYYHCIPARAASWLWFGRRLGVTSTGYLCQLRKECEAEDEVAMILGLCHPQILRRNPDGTFRLVGAAFIPGLMNEEGLDMGISKELITIV